MKKLFSMFLLLGALSFVLAACSDKEEVKEVVKEEKPSAEAEKPKNNETENKTEAKEEEKEEFVDSVQTENLSQNEEVNLTLRGQVQKHIGFVIAQDSPDQLSQLQTMEKEFFVDRSKLVEKDKAFKEELGKEDLKLETLGYKVKDRKIEKATDSEVVYNIEMEFLDTADSNKNTTKNIQYTFVKQGNLYLIKDYELQ